MTTRIYTTYESFLARRDRKLNGVSREFAAANPDYKKANASGNTGCWNCLNCDTCERCVACTGCENCEDCIACKKCVGCEACIACDTCAGCFECLSCEVCCDCQRCSKCGDCEDCADCLGCESCEDCEECVCLRGGESDSGILLHSSNTSRIAAVIRMAPVIPTIHREVLSLAEEAPPGTADLGDGTSWRAALVVQAAGAAGRLMADATDELFAATLIYAASSRVEVHLTTFHERRSDTMESLRSRAEAEERRAQRELDDGKKYRR